MYVYPKSDIDARAADGDKVRIADIYSHRGERPVSLLHGGADGDGRRIRRGPISGPNAANWTLGFPNYLPLYTQNICYYVTSTNRRVSIVI